MFTLKKYLIENIFITMFFLLFVHSTLYSQNVQGTITDPLTGKGIAGLIVSIGDSSAISDTLGHYIIHLGLQPIVNTPSILFDESHNESNTLSLSRAQIIDPQHPEWHYLGQLKNRVEQDFSINSLFKGPISIDSLIPHQILILAVPQSDFSNDEINAIIDYVNRGGSLFIMGDAFMSLNVNQLLQKFGFTYNSTPLASDSSDWDKQSFRIKDFNTHIITNDVHIFLTNWSASIDVTDSTYIFARTDSNTWRDTNNNSILDTNENKGPFIFGCIQRYGNGTVVCIGDNSFTDALFNQCDNSLLLLNILNWLKDTATIIPSPIPVELTFFNCNLIDNKVQLTWKTATEKNNRGFEIERRFENHNWENIGFSIGKGTRTDTSHYQFSDELKNLSFKGQIKYRLKQIDYNGSYRYSNEVNINIDIIPKDYSISQNYPNPFNPTTIISYSIPQTNFVRIKVYDVLGREVETLVNEEKRSGNYKIEFNSSKHTSGIYFYRMQAGNFIETKKMIVLK